LPDGGESSATCRTNESANGPKELAKLYEQKKAAAAAAVTAEAAKQQAQMAELKKRVEQGRVAMRDVVIPYFQELASGHVPAGTVQVQSRCAD
jgi:phage terminase Nu1 subunit (DNA packaging protein)